MRFQRTPLTAFLLAPLAAPIGYWVGLLLWGMVLAARGAGSSAPTFRSALVVLGLVLASGAPIAYAAALVGGLPVYLALRRAGWLGRVQLWVAGAAIGAVVAVILAPGLGRDLIRIPMPPWAGAALGVAAAETFWRVHPRPGRA